MGEDGDPEDPERQPLLGGGGPIRVKVVTLQQSREVEARADGTVDELREAIRAALAIPAAHRVRLIHAGKMLSEGGKTLAECHIHENNDMLLEEQNADGTWPPLPPRGNM